MNRITYLPLLLLLLAITANAQKPPIAPESIGNWENFSERKIAPDGAWASFATTNGNGQTALRLAPLAGGATQVFPGWRQGRFSGDGRYFAGSGPGDSVLLLELSTGARGGLAGARRFQWAERDSRVQAWLTGPEEVPFLVVRRGADTVLRAGDATAFWLAPAGDAVLYTCKVPGGQRLLYRSFDRQGADTVAAGTGFGTPAFDADWKRIALAVSNADSTRLLLFRPSGREAKYQPMPAGSSGTAVRFFGRWISYTLNSDPVQKTTAAVTVWRSTDTDLPTFREKEAYRRGSAPRWFGFDPESGRTVGWSAGNDESFTLPADSTGRFALAVTDEPYRRDRQWDPLARRDAFLVRLSDGVRTTVARSTAAEFQLSPGNRFVLWFDQERQHWFTYEIASGRTTRIDNGISEALANHDADLLMAPEPYGAGEWEKDDRSVLLQGRLGVWLADPTGSSPARLLTGRGSALRFRYYTNLQERPAFGTGDTLLFLAQDTLTKEAGFFARTASGDAAPTRLLFGPYTFGFPGMARANGRLLLSFGSTDFYGLFSSTDFIHFDTVYRLNPQQASVNWYRTRVVRWKDRKGRALEGLLFLPENFDGNRKYPLLTWIYESGNAGNRFLHVVPRWTGSIINYAFYASQGYAVFLPDIRYRTGAPGESAYEAVMGGIDHLQREGWVDSTRLGLQSHSWGGYQVAYIVTRTNRFKAAAAGAVVANMTSAYGGLRTILGESRQWIYEKHQSRIGATLWEAPGRYIRNSPLFAADKIRTPLLLVHGEADGVVPFAQSVEFFTALKRLQRPAWLLAYPGETHVLSRPANQKDMSTRMFGFFEHYLKGRPAPEWMK
ncbi:MAG: S9 family peptidase [Chitinophagaceae bacterium]|nr:MAG: S9 family peptidase [Chitinophagaceae bacterium]